jgi:hypothetical protein
MARRGKSNATVRIDEALWGEFGRLTGDRSAVIRQFIRWYVRERGATLPKRPSRSAETDHGSDLSPSAA